MNYNDSPPSLKARAAHLALALSSAAAVLTLFRMPRFLKRLAADLDNHPARETNRD